MLNIDPRTIVMMAAIMSLQMAVVLWLMKRNYPPHVRGLGWWAFSPVMWLLTATLFGAQRMIPSAWSLVAPNLLLLGGVLMHFHGTRLFLGRPTPRRAGWFTAALLVASAALLWFLTAVLPNYGLRVLYVASVLTVLYGSYVLLLQRHGGGRFPARLLQVALVLQILVLLVRMGGVLLGHSTRDLLESTGLQLIYLTAYSLTVLTLAIGAVLMANDRLRVELEHLATHDELTGVRNRRAFMQTLRDELAHAGQGPRGPALLLIDLDHFKRVNDAMGHQHGDAVLARFATQVRGVLRRTDTFGRYGGEEFVVLLPDTSADGALTTAQAIHRALAQGHALDNTVSIGVSVWRGPDDSAEQLLARADAAVYRAKAAGRNQSVLADA